MARDAKSANSDYGSFCATPTELAHTNATFAAPPHTNAATFAAPPTSSYQRAPAAAPASSSSDQPDNSIISGVRLALTYFYSIFNFYVYFVK